MEIKDRVIPCKKVKPFSELFFSTYSFILFLVNIVFVPASIYYVVVKKDSVITVILAFLLANFLVLLAYLPLALSYPLHKKHSIEKFEIQNNKIIVKLRSTQEEKIISIDEIVKCKAIGAGIFWSWYLYLKYYDPNKQSFEKILILNEELDISGEEFGELYEELKKYAMKNGFVLLGANVCLTATNTEFAMM